TDPAGNTATSTFSGINIDRTPPNLSATATTADGLAYNGALTSQSVTVRFTCRDAPGGSGVSESIAPQTISAQGLNQSVTGTCHDVAGNPATLTYSNINIVKSAPTANVVLTSGGQPYSPGSWTNLPVQVSLTCVAVPGVGIASQIGQTVVTREGSGQFVRVTCTDVVGNTESNNVGPINIDTTPPELTVLGRTGGNANGWRQTRSTRT